MNDVDHDAIEQFAALLERVDPPDRIEWLLMAYRALEAAGVDVKPLVEMVVIRAQNDHPREFAEFVSSLR